MNTPTISRKELLKDYRAIVDRWLRKNGEPSFAIQLESLSNDFAALLAEKVAIDDHQNALRGAIGRAKSAGDSAGDLIDEMRLKAKHAKTLNASINSTADSIIKILESDENANSGDLPIIVGPGQFKLPFWTHTGYVALDHVIAGTQSAIGVTNSSCNESSDAVPVEAKSRYVAESVEGEIWDEYINNHPEATHYHQYAWRKVIANNFKQRVWYLTVLDSDGKVSGVLSLVHMNSRITGNYLLSMPWLIYGGSLTSDETSSELLADHVKQQIIELGCTHAELRQVHPRQDWQLMPGKVAMVLALPASVAKLNESLGSALRSQVRRSMEYEPEIEFGGAELVTEFYRVFSEKMRDLGTPVYQRSFFEDITSTFHDSTTVVVVRMAGLPVAAAILVNFRNTVEIPWAAARRKYNSYGVNMFMYQQILEYSIHQGYEYFDFGRSTVDTGTYRFKKQWGAKPFDLGWHRTLGTEDDQGNTDNSQMSLKFRVASAVWSKIPVWLSKIIGPPISRHLPW